MGTSVGVAAAFGLLAAAVGRFPELVASFATVSFAGFVPVISVTIPFDRAEPSSTFQSAASVADARAPYDANAQVTAWSTAARNGNPRIRFQQMTLIGARPW